MTGIDNEDEMMAEHLAEKARLEAEATAKREQEEEARRVKWVADQQAANDRMWLRKRPLLVEIGKAADCDYEIDEEKRQLIFLIPCSDEPSKNWRVNVSNHFHIDEGFTSSGSGWHARSRATGLLEVVVGDYGDRKRFKVKPTTGRHNFAKIAERLDSYAHNKVAETIHNRKQAANKSTSSDLQTELKLSDWYGAMRVFASAEPEKPVSVKIEGTYNMTPENVRKLHAAMVEIGIIKVS